MSTLDSYQCNQRWEQIPAPIRNLSYNDPVVHVFLDRFVAGDIMTFEETLYQLVVAQSEDRKRILDAYTEYSLLTPYPIRMRPGTSPWEILRGKL